MPQLVEPTTPDAQREIIRQSLRRDRRRSRHRPARRSSGFSGLSDSPELWRLTCNDGLSNRPVRRRLGTCFGDRLSHHRATIGRRSTERTVTTLRGGECDDGRRRCYSRHGERAVTVSKRSSGRMIRSKPTKDRSQSLNQIAVELQRALRDVDWVQSQDFEQRR